jgi:hypothetical protein
MTDTAERRVAPGNGDGPDMGAIERVVALGDLSKLTPDQRAAYYFEICSSLRLNPLTRPFEYLMLSGKLVLYARKDATDQLRNLHRVSLEITSRETVGDLYVVTARARTVDGRTDEEIGAVNIKGLAGDALANAFMKASTKAKRRVTLSVCGLGVLDETELETVRDAVPFPEEGRTFGRRQVEDEPLPASTSGAAARLQAEIDDLPAPVDPPVQDPQPPLLEAPAAPDHPEYRRMVEAMGQARALGMRVPDPPAQVSDPGVWTDIANQWDRAVRSRRPAR